MIFTHFSVFKINQNWKTTTREVCKGFPMKTVHSFRDILYLGWEGLNQKKKSQIQKKITP